MRFLSPIPDSDGFPRLGSSPLRQSRRLEKPEGFLTPNGVGSAHRTRLSPRRRQGEASLVVTVARSRPTGHLRVSISSPKAPQRTGLYPWRRVQHNFLYGTLSAAGGEGIGHDVEESFPGSIEGSQLQCHWRKVNFPSKAGFASQTCWNSKPLKFSPITVMRLLGVSEPGLRLFYSGRHKPRALVRHSRRSRALSSALTH